MKHHIISAALASAVLLLSATPLLAEESKDTGVGLAPPAKSANVVKSKAGQKTAEIKPLDINSARKEQLKTLQGIGDAEADRIIDGRPYGSKYSLMTDNVIPEGVFMSNKDLIEARQPPKLGKKYMEQLKKAAEKREASAGKKAAGNK